MKRLFAIVGVLTSVSAAYGQAYGPSDAEFARLPPFCKVRMSPSTKQQVEAMNAQFGPNNFVHIHHYCLGLNFANRARLMPPSQARTDALKESIANYYYVIEKAERNFFMRPQIHTEMGRVYLQMSQKPNAAKEFASAIAANPRYEPAYLPLVETYRALGSVSAALEVATAGLRYFPNSKALRERYLTVGGKTPFPEPIPDQVQSQPDASFRANGIRPDEEQSKSVATTGNGTEGRNDGATAEGDSSAPERGCRFCPPEEIQQKWRESFGEKPN